ncbi:small G protein signaling modulator 2-like isoform X1 [Chenopodium quinoa]|uniref:small G protein signaling modulator 2-like isoform X1 n=1 Tax=Chenopodium quinoa TaxID=63459 RepID=UPI000B7941B4|nr:small G protein signaling modulator 2-like isoform X1 [Chenopodium quinoa]
MKALRRSHTCSSSPSSSSKSSPSSSNSKKHHYSPSSSSSSPLSLSWVHLRSALFVVASSSPASSSSHRGQLKSPWSRKRRKHPLTPQQWRNSFTPDGKLQDGGIQLLKKVRSGGIDPSIRAEVWPFLLGVYDLNSSKEERDLVRNTNRKEYEKLRRRSRRLLKQTDENLLNSNGSCLSSNSEPSSPASEDVVSARESLSSEKGSSDLEFSENHSSSVLDRTNSFKRVTSSSPSVICSDSSDVESSVDEQFDEVSSPFDQENDADAVSKGDLSPSKTNPQSSVCRTEDFASWQRIIRLDAVRANAEWKDYSPSQAAVSEDRARRSAEAVGLKDYDHLESCRIYHAARLVAILEAYAIYDSDIGYCQGMSDLLSPIISVIEEDHMAFWCFVGFMKKARHNFRLDEVGIRRQLNIVAKIIKHKDSHLYKHLVKLQAEDCFFVYRMVVVLFRRELNFEQTLCLWEVMWADQAALRAGVGKSAWSRIRQRAPPTEDLLLYAIAASVLQRRKQIVEKYSSMDEILRECNNMAGHLDIWKLLDGAHDLVMTLHDKIGSTF